MKLRHKIAGTFALPLALAIAASTANAATVYDDEKQTLKVGGFVAAQAYWEMPDDGEVNYGMSLGTTRLNISHTTKTADGDITIMYENDWVGGYRLRHAAVMYDGWVAGHTWSFFANNNGLGETLDANGNAITSSWANRNAVLGKNISLGDDMSVGIALEDRSLNSGNTSNDDVEVKFDTATGEYYEDITPGKRNTSPVPDITANFKAKVGGVGLFAAAQMYQVNDSDDDKKSEGKVRFTASAAVPLGDAATIKAAFTSDEGATDAVKHNALSVSGQYKITDQIRTNLVVEQYMADGDDKDYTQVWANIIYRMPVGLEWGAEVHMVSGDSEAGVNAHADGAGKEDGDMAFRLQAKYAF